MINPYRIFLLLQSDSFFNSIVTHKRALINGTDVYETQCFLKNIAIKNENQLYGNAHGSGTSVKKLESQLKSMSEALEYLAFLTYKNTNQFGFNDFPSTLGMGAFPGFSNKEALSKSKTEAIERWALVEWWAGNLKSKKYDTKSKDINFFEIEIPFNEYHVIICSHFCTKIHKYVYGFSCSTKIQSAMFQAVVEASRNFFIFKNAKSENLNELNIREKRVSYFSSADGHKLFQDKINNSNHSSKTKPRLILSEEIFGDWSKYASICRTLYEFSNVDFLNEEKIDQFYF